MKFYTIIIIAVLAFVLGYVIRPTKTIHSTEHHTDTCYITKVVRDTICTKVKEVEIRRDTVILYTVDSVLVEVPIPITQVEHTGKIDSVEYQAFVSGYKPKLDSINFRVNIPIITSTIIEHHTSKQKAGLRLSLGIYGGYSPINKNLDVVIGGGIGFVF